MKIASATRKRIVKRGEKPNLTVFTIKRISIVGIAISNATSMIATKM